MQKTFCDIYIRSIFFTILEEGNAVTGPDFVKITNSDPNTLTLDQRLANDFKIIRLQKKPDIDVESACCGV